MPTLNCGFGVDCEENSERFRSKGGHWKQTIHMFDFASNLHYSDNQGKNEEWVGAINQVLSGGKHQGIINELWMEGRG